MGVKRWKPVKKRAAIGIILHLLKLRRPEAVACRAANVPLSTWRDWRQGDVEIGLKAIEAENAMALMGSELMYNEVQRLLKKQKIRDAKGKVVDFKGVDLSNIKWLLENTDREAYHKKSTGVNVNNQINVVSLEEEAEAIGVGKLSDEQLRKFKSQLDSEVAKAKALEEAEVIK